MTVIVGLWQKNLIATTKWICADPSEVGMRQHRLTWIVVINRFCLRPTITAISWSPPRFHNFFTLAILHRTARLGRTLFYSLHYMAIFEWLKCTMKPWVIAYPQQAIRAQAIVARMAHHFSCIMCGPQGLCVRIRQITWAHDATIT